jgi:hypothetical protein
MGILVKKNVSIQSPARCRIGHTSAKYVLLHKRNLREERGANQHFAQEMSQVLSHLAFWHFAKVHGIPYASGLKRAEFHMAITVLLHLRPGCGRGQVEHRI